MFVPSPLTPPHSPYAFDLMAEVGRLRFLAHRQFTEIQALLRERGLDLPSRTLQRLADRFAVYAVAVHLESLPNVVGPMLRRQGGYVLLLDGTGRSGRMTLQMTDGWSELVLLAATIRQESEEEVVPHLRRLDALLGRPVAAVRDMSAGFDAALRRVWLGIYRLLCHFHFLRAEGLKLFDSLYAIFRTQIDRRGIKGKLRAFRKDLRGRAALTASGKMVLLWVEEILGATKSGRGRTYPFRLPALELFTACERVARRVEAAWARGEGGRGATPLSRLRHLLEGFLEARRGKGSLAAQAEALRERWVWFERTRKVLRYRNGPVPLSTAGMLSDEGLARGRRRLEWLLRRLEAEAEGAMRSPRERKLRTVLRKVWRDLMVRRGELFAPNVEVMVEGKRVRRGLPRTTARAEQEFRKLRRHGRRIRGSAQVEGQVQREGPAMMMVENLRNPRYVREVYGSLARLGERFARVRNTTLREAKLLTGLQP